jgi:HD-like signal output (HDOD) protein
MTWEQFRKHVRNLARGYHNLAEHDWSDDTNTHASDEPAARKPGTSPNTIERKAKRKKQ